MTLSDLAKFQQPRSVARGLSATAELLVLLSHTETACRDGSIYSRGKTVRWTRRKE